MQREVPCFAAVEPLVTVIQIHLVAMLGAPLILASVDARVVATTTVSRLAGDQLRALNAQSASVTIAEAAKLATAP